MKDENIESLTCSSALLAGISNDILQEIRQRTSVKQYEKGETIAREGVECKSLGIILEGKVSMVRISSSGEFSSISLLSEKEIFGEDILYSSRNTYQYSVEAATNCKIRFIPKTILKSIMEKSPSTKDMYLKILSDRVEKLNRRIQILSQKTLREKIAYYIVDLCRTQGSNTVELPASKEVIAKLLAMPRQSFSRELAKMENDGIITTEDKKITILDRNLLENEIVEGLKSL